MKRKFLALILSVLMLVSLMPTMALAAEGDVASVTIESGTTNYADLHAALEAAKNGGTVKLLCDVTLTSAWTPVGNEGDPFKGTLNGEGHTITGLTINADSGSYFGLIGVLDGGRVENVKFAGVAIVAYDDTGAAVGRIVKNGTVSGVNVLSGSVQGNKRTGGVVGSIKAYGTIENCTNAATVNAKTYNAGGIVGAAYYTVKDQEMYLTGCTNTATVTSAGNCAGGIVGLSAANVTNCTNSAAVSGAGTSIGGVVGEQKSYGSVTNNTNSGVVKNSDNGSYGNGGIIGWLRYHSSSENSAYAQSDIITVAGNSNSGSVSGGNDAGGIVGTVYNSATIINNTNSAASLSGTTFAAGIVGNYQTTETPSAAKPANNKLIFVGNASSTSADSISAANKNESIYTNGNAIIEACEAQIGDTYYDTLDAAIAAANSGDTVTLLGDVAYKTNGKGLFNLTKSITLDGNGHKISGYGSRGGNKTTLAVNFDGQEKVSVELKNLTIDNDGYTGRAVETRGNIENLKITNCKFNCTGGGNTQVLTIGGNQSTVADVTIDGGSVLSAGTAGYPIVVYNPMNLQISDNSKLTGYCGIYFKGVDSSEGSHGSVVNATNCTFDCPNIYDDTDNTFGVFALEDDDITIKLTDCRINAEATGTAQQAVFLASSYAAAGRRSKYDFSIGGNSVVNATILDFNWSVDPTENHKISITGGTFSSDPSAYVASGYAVRGSGPYTVYMPYYDGPSTPTTPTTPSQPSTSTETKPDGSTTTTETKPDGTVTESNTSAPTTDASGNTSQTTTETTTGKDGVTESKTETTTKPDGSASSTTESTTTKPDGTKTESTTETTINKDGSTASTTTSTTTGKDGTVTESKTEATTSTVTNADGSTTETKQETTTTSTGSKTESTTVTTVNTDGSTTATTTATTTDKAGTVTESKTESTTNKNGTTTEKTTTTETKANGTVTESKTETTINKDGSSKATTTETVTKADGTTVESKTEATTSLSTNKTTGTVTETKKETTTTSTGVKSEGTTVTQIQKDGTVTSTETVKASDSTGTTATKTTTLDAKGEVTTKAEATVSTKAVTEAAKTGGAVTLPVEVTATKSASTAPTVAVKVPATAESVKVELPVQNVTPGTVAVIVKADGTEEIVKTSIVTEDGVALNVDGNAQIKLVDNSTTFTDVRPVDHWASDEIDFSTSRELFKGTSDTTFTPEGTVTRAMLYTVMARFDDADVVTTGANWYADSLEWAKANNVSDGTNPTGNITREQLATMLYRYVGEPAVTGSTDSYADAGSVSDYAAAAMQWAVENGLINGINGRLQPQGYATRAQLAAIMQRFCANVMF